MRIIINWGNCDEKEIVKIDFVFFFTKPFFFLINNYTKVKKGSLNGNLVILVDEEKRKSYSKVEKVAFFLVCLFDLKINNRKKKIKKGNKTNENMS